MYAIPYKIQTCTQQNEYSIYLKMHSLTEVQQLIQLIFTMTKFTLTNTRFILISNSNYNMHIWARSPSHVWCYMSSSILCKFTKTLAYNNVEKRIGSFQIRSYLIGSLKSLNQITTNSIDNTNLMKILSFRPHRLLEGLKNWIWLGWVDAPTLRFLRLGDLMCSSPSTKFQS